MSATLFTYYERTTQFGHTIEVIDGLQHRHAGVCMMTSSYGNIFRATGPLCGEFTGEFPS